MSTGQQVGYVRVSSVQQNTDRQLADLKLDEVFEEYLSGKDTNRPQLEACLKHVRQGDTLHIHSIDRLARNLKNLQEIVEDLIGRGVTVVFHKENLTFNPLPTSVDNEVAVHEQQGHAMQRLMLQMMGAFAEFERSLIRERQREGIEAAKAKGKHLGRPRTVTDDAIKEMLKAVDDGEPKSKVAQRYGISRTKLYQIIKQHNV